jgi:hypothetical protein
VHDQHDQNDQTAQTGAVDPELYRLVLDAVNRQIKRLDPPEPRRTYYRLEAAGYTPDNARLQIAYVLSIEIIRSLESRQPFHESRYATSLRRLPLLPEIPEIPPPQVSAP